MIHLGSFVLRFPIPSIKVEPPETNDNSNKSRSMATVTVQGTKQSGKELAGAGSSSSTSRHPGFSANKASTSTSAGKSSTGNIHSRSYSPTNSVVSSVESISRRVEERNTSKGIPPRRTIPIPALPLIKGSRRISRFNSNESIGSAGPSHSFTVFPKLPGSNDNANTRQVVEPQNARRESRESGGGGHGSRQEPQKNKADVDDRGEKRRRLSEPVPSTGTATNTNHRPVEGRQAGTKGPAAVVTPAPVQPHARTNSGIHVASHRDREREKHENRNRSQERMRNDRDRGDRNRNQENRHQHNNHNHAHHNRHSTSRPPPFNKNHQHGYSRDGRRDGNSSPRKENYANRHDTSSRRPGPGSQSRNVQYYCREVTELKQEQIQIKEEVIDLTQQFAIRNEEYDDNIYSINRRQDEQGSHIIHLHRENDQTKARLEKMERQIRQGQQQQQQPTHNAGPATEGFKCPDCHHVFQSKSYMLRKHKGTSACIKNQTADGTRGGAAGSRTPACSKAAARAKPTPEATYGRFAERGSSSLGRPHWNRQEGEKSPPFNVTSRLRPPRLQKQKNTTRRR